MVVTISAVPSLATRGDKDTFSERYLSAAGCLSPLFLIKIIIVLIVILLMPLFLLPMLIGRMATFGGAAVRYSSVVDMTSGEQARWGYGTLSVSSDGQALRRGVAAIAARDPAFDPASLTRWAATAAELICASLTSADATPARTFMDRAGCCGPIRPCSSCVPGPTLSARDRGRRSTRCSLKPCPRPCSTRCGYGSPARAGAGSGTGRPD